MNNVHDISIITTSSAAVPAATTLEGTTTAIDGDGAFTNDSKYALWYSEAHFDQTVPIGIAMAAPVDGSSPPIMLAPLASVLATYGSPTNVLIMTNTQLMTDINGNQHLLADIAVRRFDGSDALNVLVPGVDARVYRARRQTIVYRIASGDQAGLWLLTLPQ
jgi:hypothetical protein